MEGTHVVIDGKHYHRDNLHTLPDELNTFDVTSNSNRDCLGFFGELPPVQQLPSVPVQVWRGRIQQQWTIYTMEKGMVFQGSLNLDKDSKLWGCYG